MKLRTLHFALITGLILACVLPSSAQHFQQIQGATLAKISAGGASVWGTDPFDNVFRYNQTTQTFDQISGASLFQVSVGGGTFIQPDEVWGINGSGQVFRFNPSTQTFDQIPVPGTALDIAVGPGHSHCNNYEVWGITKSRVFRYNFCTSTFDPMNTGNIPFTYISVGGSEVWGGRYFKTFRFNFEKNYFESFATMPEVVPGADAVYGINNGEAYYFDSYSWRDFFFAAKTLAAGGNGVWATNASNQVFSLLPTFPSFVQIPGSLARISVGTGTGVWGINTTGQVFVFETP